MIDAVSRLSALAQDSRLAVFRALVAAAPGGLPAGEIATQLALPAPTLSFHLAQLKMAGLVTCRREGRSLIYAADMAGMNALIGFLTDACCGGRPEACLPAVTALSSCATIATERPEASQAVPSRRARG